MHKFTFVSFYWDMGMGVVCTKYSGTHSSSHPTVAAITITVSNNPEKVFRTSPSLFFYICIYFQHFTSCLTLEIAVCMSVCLAVYARKSL